MKSLVKKQSLKDKAFINNLIATLIVIGHKYQPTISDLNFSSYLCINLYREDTKIEFLEADLDVKCWESTHLSYSLGMALPLIVIWFVVLPGLLFRIIYKNRKQLMIRNLKERYSFLYRGYKSKVYYWEFLVMLRKYALVLVILLGRLHSR